VSYFDNTYLQSDLDMFFRNFSPASVGKSPVLVSINGGGSFRILSSNASAEVGETGSIEPEETSGVGEDDWILEYAMTLTQPQPVMFLQVGGKQTGALTNVGFWSIS
jgi:tripeptidyl-peptidase-1